ncbi:BgTH12-01059 [Blumeria graminis f. sp. triticale]|uniref:BgTH12-01059 n=1 Tax=Blumeria graminis f. sp. triticale TaxID=1689686 RepID=A0A9W4GHD8_BLUGR|nr:BgTH12-01059 [Blumeria graminis f. sp. triticale]
MSCLLAILLYTGGRSSMEDRLVVMDLAPQRSFYQTHSSNRDRWFPSVAHVDDIIMGPSPTKRPGTHMTIYCSQTRSKASLLEFVTAGSKKLIRSTEYGIRPETKLEAECLNYIEDALKNKSNNQLANPKIKPSSICSKDIISSLRSDGKLRAFEDENAKYLHSSNTPAASLHEPTKIATVVLNGHFLRLATIDKMSFGLAWYHGFLTVFRMDVDEYWRPIEGLSQDNYVLKFLAATSLAIRLMMEEVAKIEIKVVLRPQIGQSPGNDQNITKKPSILSLLQALDRSEFKFTEYIATGFLGKGIKIQRPLEKL